MSRKRKDIEKEFITLGRGIGNMMQNKHQLAAMMNPRLELEVLLDIRDLLIEIKNK